MLLLLVMLLFADFLQRGIILGSFRSVTAVKERESLFSEVLKSNTGSVFIYMYEVGIVAMTLYLLLAREDFCFWKYGFIVLCVCLLSLFKYLILRLVVCVFLDKHMLPPILMHYDNLNVVVCTLLYPIALLGLFAPLIGKTTILIILCTICIFALSIWLLKALRLFLNNFIAIFYIFLYLCTLEVIPFVGMIVVIRYLVF